MNIKGAPFQTVEDGLEPQGELKDVFGLLYTLVPAVANAQLPAAGRLPAAATQTRPAASTFAQALRQTNDVRTPGVISNLTFPPGWYTNPALRAQIMTNPAYRAWYSNYLQRARTMTDLSALTNRGAVAGGGQLPPTGQPSTGNVPDLRVTAPAAAPSPRQE